jgi:2-polyprenyl-6-methoxyphenol hydroxylase-like FAD-dependent oxidoreductase
MKPPRIDIIGAGIGGLTAAIALQQRGFQVRVYEQAQTLEPIGAGITLANNAMQVYEKLGIRQALQAQGNPISVLKITQPNLQAISTIDLRPFEQKNGVKNVAIHRGALQQVLLDQLPTEDVHLDHSLLQVEKQHNSYQLIFENKPPVTSSVLIGADGLHSAVRRELFSSNQVRYVRQVCWRGVTDYALPARYRHELNEAWGKSDRFGFVQLGHNQTYWYALKSFQRNPEEFSATELKKYFRKYHPLIRKIINVTPPERIHTSEIADLKPSRQWYLKNACLIGDAAHATTPNLGQGACQAIEDAYVLAECLYRYETNEAFAAFARLRLPKAHQVVNTSWTLGKLAHQSNPLVIALRNQLMRLTPERVNRWQSEKLFQLASV